MVGVLRYGVLPLRLRALDLSERGTLAQVSVTGVGGLWTVREWRVPVAGSDRTMPISRVVLGLSALLTVAACSGRVSPVEPVVATGVERQDPGEPRLGEHAGFTLPELAVPEPVIPELAEPPAAARASPVAGESPSGGRVSAEPPPVVAESSDRPREAGSEEPCHPAYLPCLPDLPGNALDCTDLRNDLKPVVVLDLADDPYRLAEGGSRRACVPPAGAAAVRSILLGPRLLALTRATRARADCSPRRGRPTPNHPMSRTSQPSADPSPSRRRPKPPARSCRRRKGDSPEPPPGRPPPGGGPSDELPLESPPAESGPTEPRSRARRRSSHSLRRHRMSRRPPGRRRAMSGVCRRPMMTRCGCSGARTIRRGVRIWRSMTRAVWSRRTGRDRWNSGSAAVSSATRRAPV